MRCAATQGKSERRPESPDEIDFFEELGPEARATLYEAFITTNSFEEFVSTMLGSCPRCDSDSTVARDVVPSLGVLPAGCRSVGPNSVPPAAGCQGMRLRYVEESCALVAGAKSLKATTTMNVIIFAAQDAARTSVATAADWSGSAGECANWEACSRKTSQTSPKKATPGIAASGFHTTAMAVILGL